MYISCLVIWNSLLFGNTYKLGADQNFYGYIIFLEITSLFFIRTRTSLKFYPSLIFFSLFMYLFYINFNGYAFYSVAFLTLVFLTMTFFSLILAFVEVPAVNWNPSFHYAPSINKPRSLYFPMFSLSWYYDLPAIWTLFFPLHDRSTFTNAEMSMVDRNYVLLNQTLEQANNQQNQQGPEGQNQNMEPPQIFVPNAPANPNNNL